LSFYVSYYIYVRKYSYITFSFLVFAFRLFFKNFTVIESSQCDIIKTISSTDAIKST